MTATCYTVGLDPYIGLYHRPRFGRPAMALNLMEEFRPLLAESVVLGVLNNGEVSEDDFLRRGIGVALTDTGARAVLRSYERRLATEVKHPLFGYTVTYRRVLEVQVRLLAAYLLGETPAYIPFRGHHRPPSPREGVFAVQAMFPGRTKAPDPSPVRTGVRRCPAVTGSVSVGVAAVNTRGSFPLGLSPPRVVRGGLLGLPSAA